MSDETASELRRLRRENARLNRRIAMMILPGRVVERDPAKWKVRLEIGTDPDTGEAIKGPWVRPSSGGAGAAKVSPALPAIGDPMYLFSASGLIGGDSVAWPGTSTDDSPRPNQDPDETVLFERGEDRLSVKAGELFLKSGGASVKLTPGGPTFAGGQIKHDGKNIGSSHKHSNVRSGSDETGVPTA